LLEIDRSELFDVVVIGAGLAGSICAKKLANKDYKILILEKSRGVGGRAATRRIEGFPVDHGLQYLKIQPDPAPELAELLQQLCDRQIIESWHGNVYELNTEKSLQATPPAIRYIAPEGMTAIAKYLCQDLQVRQQCLVKAIAPEENRQWRVSYESVGGNLNSVRAKAVVITIPAPQSLPILQASNSIPANFLSQINTVEYSRCIAVMAEYSQNCDLPSWQAVKVIDDSDLAWIALDSNKRKTPEQPIFVLHSTDRFARDNFDNQDLNSVAQKLLNSAAKSLLPWLDRPEKFQVHRWRYALTANALPVSCLSTSKPLPLVGCGDWCGGKFAESAFLSGIASAIEIDRLLNA
jgi:renalase